MPCIVLVAKKTLTEFFLGFLFEGAGVKNVKKTFVKNVKKTFQGLAVQSKTLKTLKNVKKTFQDPGKRTSQEPAASQPASSQPSKKT